MFNLYDRQGSTPTLPATTALTIGVFDGVHRGHVDLLRQLRQLAAGRPTLVVTLTTHPSFVLGRRSEELWLDEADEHRQRLFQAGADYVAELPFTPSIAALTACEMATTMHQRLGMSALLLGYDSRFGSRQNDDFALLPETMHRLGIDLAQGVPYLYQDQPVSSSRIRLALQEGAIDEATDLLGHPYQLHGQVVHGRGVGHALGFPTANVDMSHCRKTIPREGVYAVRLNGHAAMANLGPMPTFGIDKPALEVHLIHWQGDLYGQAVEVEFVRRLRDTAHFDTPQQLQEQLNLDIQQALQCT